jgi:hypothetical protein
MRRHGHEIRKKNGRLASGRKAHAHHVVGVAGEDDQLDAGHHLAVFAFHKLPLPRFHHGLEIVGDVADAIALGGMAGVFEFAAMHEVARVGKRGHGLAVDDARIPSAMIEMQMRVDDDVDLLGFEPARGQLRE